MDPSAQDQQADRTVRLAVDLVNLRTRLKESPARRPAATRPGWRPSATAAAAGPVAA